MEVRMVFPEQLCGRPKAQPVQTETGGKRPADYLQKSLELDS